MLMKYMLDTNVIISLLRLARGRYEGKGTDEANKARTVRKNFELHSISDVCISIITYAELAHGVMKSTHVERDKVALALFLSNITVANLSIESVEQYAEITARLEKDGNPIGKFDTFIAAHAKELRLVLVTDNVQEFSRVKDLPIENWTIVAE